jgi:hypothetical protein
LSVSGLAGSAPTKKKRKGSDAAERASVAPLPSMVMSLAMAGRAFGPYQLSTCPLKT